MAAAAFVLALAMGSAVVWVLYAAPAPTTDGFESDWWPGLHALPQR